MKKGMNPQTKTEQIVSDPLLVKAREIMGSGTINDIDEIYDLISDLNFEAIEYMKIAKILKYNYDVVRVEKRLETRNILREKDGKAHTEAECDNISKQYALSEYGACEVREQYGRGYIRIADQLRDKCIRLQTIDKQQRQNTEY